MSTAIMPLTRINWQELAQAFQEYNYHQIWDFGKACATRLRATSEHVAIQKDGEIIGLADIRIKRVSFLKIGIAYINGGPLVNIEEGGQYNNLRFCLESLIQEYANKRGFLLRIQPPLGPAERNQNIELVYKEKGFVSLAKTKSYRTILLDIQPPIDNIRKNLAQKWRNCLNKSEKLDNEIRSGTDIHLFAEFCNLYKVMLERKNFDVDLDANFYYRLQEHLADREKFYISIAYSDNKPIAGHVSSMLGHTCVYLLGASNGTGLKKKASYILQWHTIKVARDLGYKWYDLGGIDPENNPGVYHFKKGLGGSDITAPGPFEISPNGLKRYIALKGEKIYRTIQKLAQIT